MPVRSRWRGMRVAATMAEFPDPAPREAAEDIAAVAAAAGGGLARFLAAGTASASRPSPGITGWRPAWQPMATSRRNRPEVGQRELATGFATFLLWGCRHRPGTDRYAQWRCEPLCQAASRRERLAQRRLRRLTAWKSSA